MLINRVGGGGENVTPEVTAQTPLIQELAILALGKGLNVKGKYLWLKTINGKVDEIIVSTSSTAYTEGLNSDGYYYIKITHALGIDENGDTFTIEI